MGYSQLCALNSLSAILGDHVVRGIALGTREFSSPGARSMLGKWRGGWYLEIVP